MYFWVPQQTSPVVGNSSMVPTLASEDDKVVSNEPITETTLIQGVSNSGVNLTLVSMQESPTGDFNMTDHSQMENDSQAQSNVTLSQQGSQRGFMDDLALRFHNMDFLSIMWTTAAFCTLVLCLIGIGFGLWKLFRICQTCHRRRSGQQQWSMLLGERRVPNEYNAPPIMPLEEVPGGGGGTPIPLLRTHNQTQINPFQVDSNGLICGMSPDIWATAVAREVLRRASAFPQPHHQQPQGTRKSSLESFQSIPL